MCPSYFLMMDNLALQQERDKFEKENSLPPSRSSTDFMRNSVVNRKIQKLFKRVTKDLTHPLDLEQFHKVYLIIDKDLDLKSERVNREEYMDFAEKAWEKRGRGKFDPNAHDVNALLTFLEDSNLLKRDEM